MFGRLQRGTWFLALYGVMFGLLALDLPFAVYQFARVVWLIAGVHCCVLCHRTASWCVWPALVLFILMQPLFKISLTKEAWRVIDLLAMAGLLAMAFAYEKKFRTGPHEASS